MVLLDGRVGWVVGWLGCEVLWGGWMEFINYCLELG